MEIYPIAYARNGFTDKFGIPRQSRPDSVLLTRIEFADGYRDRNMLRGIEDYSHLWLIWGFGTSPDPSLGRGDLQGGNMGWSPTVRPPRLGGNERMGVLATRSPFRPNNLGLTSVELVKVESDGSLVVRGADLLNGTPIYDIKPYLSFSDSHPDARNGFAEAHKNDHLEVVGLDEELGKLGGLGRLGELGGHASALEEILSQDPRPSYQDDPERIYHLDYDGYRVDFRVADRTCIVVKVEKEEKR